MRSHLRTGAFAAGVLMAVGCSNGGRPPDDGTPTPRVETLVVADRNEPRTLNPLLIGGLSEDLQVLLFSCLLRSGPRGELIPDVAARIPSLENGDIARDGRSITYHLRPGVRWQDGFPLTARDVVYTYQQIMNPKNDTGARIPYVDVASASAPDDRTLKVRLKRVDAAFVPKFFAGSFCWGILPQHLLRGYEALNEVPFNAMPIGSGPFRVRRWLRGDRLVLDPNDRYFLGTPHLRIVDRFVSDRSTIVTELRTGELEADFRADPAEAIATVANPRLRILKTPLPAAGTLLFNVSDPLLRDPRVRTALGFSIDAAAVARDVSLGLYLPADPGRAAFAWAYDPSVKRPHYDPAAAARMFDALGWRLTSDGLRRKGGRPLSLTLIAASEGLDPSFCIALQFQFRRAGIDVNVKNYDPSTFNAPASDGGPLRKGAFQLAYLPEYYIDFDADLSSELNCDRQPPKGFNFGHYCNTVVDRANRSALDTLDLSRRKRYYRFVQQQLALDPPWLPLWRLAKVDIVTRRLRGFVATPRYDPYYGVQNWRLTP
jgi:peptide/nickel transport system substrate-binding protein